MACVFSVEKTEYKEGDMCPIEFARYSQDETGFTPRLDSGATCPGPTAEVILMYIGQNENPKHVKCERNLDFHHMHNSRWQLFSILKFLNTLELSSHCQEQSKKDCISHSLLWEM